MTSLENQLRCFLNAQRGPTSDGGQKLMRISHSPRCRPKRWEE
jgi:hypothetical protein